MDGKLDLLLTGGRVLDSATGRDEIADIGVKDGAIAAIDRHIPVDAAGAVEDVSGQLVVAGLIDTHGHVYQHVTGKFGLPPDQVGVASGVTTVVDQGGPSCMTIPGFRNFIVDRAETRILCFISAYLVGGLEGHLYPALYGPDQVDVAHTVRAARENADIVRGVKAHAEIGGASRWGLDVIKLAKRIAREAGLPLYIHLGQLWPTEGKPVPDPDALVAELVPLMDEGDILAHPFTRHPGGFVSARTGEVSPVIRAGLDRGVVVDIGHGSHFSFAVARRALAAGIRPFTLGADMHGYNVTVLGGHGTDGHADDGSRSASPFHGVAPFNLTHAMTELLALGMALPEIVASVTGNAAAMLRLSDSLGSLAVGRAADISVLRLTPGRFVLRDNSGEAMIASTMISPVFALRQGRRFAADSALVPPVEIAA
jgi:dihydroorotase